MLPRGISRRQQVAETENLLKQLHVRIEGGLNRDFRLQLLSLAWLMRKSTLETLFLITN